VGPARRLWGVLIMGVTRVASVVGVVVRVVVVFRGMARLRRGLMIYRRIGIRRRAELRTRH